MSSELNLQFLLTNFCFNPQLSYKVDSHFLQTQVSQILQVFRKLQFFNYLSHKQFLLVEQRSWMLICMIFAKQVHQTEQITFSNEVSVFHFFQTLRTNLYKAYCHLHLNISQLFHLFILVNEIFIQNSTPTIHLSSISSLFYLIASL